MEVDTPTDPPLAPQPRRGLSRLLYRAFGSVALALGFAGLFLPVLPTTPFVLLAAWAFARGSPKLHEALRRHPRLGPPLRDWERYRAIPRAAKIAAVVGMTLSFLVVVVLSRHWAGPVIVGLIMLCSGAYVVSRPAPPPLAKRDGEG